MMKILEIKGLSFKRENRYILRDINLEVEKGELVVIRGKNGAGKSTLLKIIAGLEKEDSGDIYLCGEKINDLTIEERAKKGLILLHQILPEIEIKIRDLEDALKTSFDLAEDWKDKELFRGFSGGERKLIEFEITKSLKPKLWLIDEIDSGLDLENAKKISKRLNELLSGGATMIIVTHTGAILEHIEKKPIIYTLEDAKLKKV